MENIKFKKHGFFLSFISVLGTSMVFLPKEKGIFPFLFAFLMGILSYFIVRFFIFKIDEKYKKIIFAIIFLLCVYIGISALISSSDYVFKYIFKKRVSQFLCFALLLIFVLYLTFKKASVGLEFSLMLGVLSLVLLLILLLLLFVKVNFIDIFSKEIFGFSFDIKNSIFYFRECFLVCLIFPVYEKLTFEETRAKISVWAIISASVLLILIMLCTYGILGNKAVEFFEFPFSDAVSVLSVGKIFSRLDGLLYFVYLFTASVKIYFCFFTAKKLIANLRA